MWLVGVGGEMDMNTKQAELAREIAALCNGPDDELDRDARNIESALAPLFDELRAKTDELRAKAAALGLLRESYLHLIQWADGADWSEFSNPIGTQDAHRHLCESIEAFMGDMNKAARTAEIWWTIGRPNRDALYGYGTKAEAEEFCGLLNAGLEIDLYTQSPTTYDEAFDLDSGARCDGFDLFDEIERRKA